MSNGNGSNFYSDVRMKIINLRIKQNNELDDLSKWVDESEQQMLAKNKGRPINHGDDKIVESEFSTKGGSEEA